MILIKRITNNILFSLLILFVIILLTPSALFSSENETGARTLVRSLPDRPVAGSTWTLTLLIDHSEPDEVEILAPHFDGVLFLEQVIKTPRLVNPGTATEAPAAIPPEFLERWTAMEYRFVLNSPGTVTFDAFTVITPQGQTMTAPFELNIQRPPNTTEVQNYRFVWEGAPSALKTGENAVFSLRYNGTHYASSLPKAAQFLPSVPPGYILESLPLASSEVSAGIALKLRLIPLEANPFTLARRQFSHNGAIFEVPALRIPVSRAAEQKPGTQAEHAATGSNITPPFPPLNTAIQNHPQLYQKYQNKCDAIYTAAKNLWEGGRRADALAELRQNERDHPAGEFFAALRRESEQALGFTNTCDEKQKKSLFGTKSRSAVLRETTVRRIPDRAGEEIARFREGQPVLLNGKTPHKTWMQVITNDDNGTSGWVSEEMIIFY
jgi:hypothetical protein